MHGEHVPAHDRGAGGVPREGHGAGDALGLGHDVVVEEQDVVGATAVEGLDHGAREAPGPTEVGLPDDAQPLPEQAVGVGEPRVVGDLTGALVDDEDGVDDLVELRGAPELGEEGGAVLRPVERRDPDGDAGRVAPVLDGLAGRDAPLRLVEDEGVGAGDEVEPEPPTVDEAREGQGHLVRRRSVRAGGW